jgi:hypothetical protein
VLLFEAGQLTTPQMERFAALADRGIADIESYLGMEGARARRSQITFEVGSRVAIARTFRGTVYLPVERVKTDSAPYLHETTHALLPTRCGCPWLAEGFASYVQAYVSENLGGYDGVIFSWGGNANVDRLARRYLTAESGQAVLSYVGGESDPPGMEWQRRSVAAPFYVLSHSFVKFLVEGMGLAPVRGMHEAVEPDAALKRMTGRSLDWWRSEWLTHLQQAGS